MTDARAKPKIVVAGAGSIGCYVGGLLIAAGRDVHLLARQRIADEIAEFGLRITDYSGVDEKLAPAAVNVSTDPDILEGADIILVTVKSGATAEIADLVKAHGPSDVSVISLQNGVSNATVLRAGLKTQDVRAGMVPYNVVHLGEGRFHRGTSGTIMIEAGAGGLGARLSAPHLPFHESAHITAVLWGKLLVNLNNALNALSGVPLLEQLSNREWRRVMADQMDEATRALDAAGIKPKSATPLPTWLLPHVLRLPTPLFRLISGSTLKIDPTARSSMWEDLTQGRMTEIDQLQGAVVQLGELNGAPTPLNARIASLIKEAEAKKAGPPGLTPEAVRVE